MQKQNMISKQFMSIGLLTWPAKSIHEMSQIVATVTITIFRAIIIHPSYIKSIFGR